MHVQWFAQSMFHLWMWIRSRGDNAAVVNDHETQLLKDKTSLYFLPHALQPPLFLCCEKLCSIFNQLLT